MFFYCKGSLLVAMVVVAAFFTLGAAAAEGPTAPVMLANKLVTAALKEAWSLSFLAGNLYQERGGWIYASSTDVSKLFVRMAAKDRSQPSKGSAEGMAIDLNKPQSNPGNPPPAGYKVVGNFHTHPLPAGNEPPSKADMINSYERGVPGIVVSTNSIWYYGPDRRGSMSGDVNYPGPNGQYTGQNPTRYGNNPFPRPTTDDEHEL